MIVWKAQVRILWIGCCKSLTTDGVLLFISVGKKLQKWWNKWSNSQTSRCIPTSCWWKNTLRLFLLLAAAVDTMPGGIMALALAAASLHWITSWQSVCVPGCRSQRNLDRSSIRQSTPESHLAHFVVHTAAADKPSINLDIKGGKCFLKGQGRCECYCAGYYLELWLQSSHSGDLWRSAVVAWSSAEMIFCLPVSSCLSNTLSLQKTFILTSY